MIKKSLGSLLAVTLLTAGGSSVFASTNVVQKQSNHAAVGQTQTSPAGSLTFQQSSTSSIPVQLGNLGMAGQGQAGSVTGSQVQAGKTSAPAVFEQSIWTKLRLTDKQTTNSSQQKLKTTAVNSINQSTAVLDPSQVVQAQMDHTAAVQFEGSVAGGAAIQYQQTNRISLQYQNVIKSVSPTNPLR